MSRPQAKLKLLHAPLVLLLTAWLGLTQSAFAVFLRPDHSDIFATTLSPGGHQETDALPPKNRVWENFENPNEITPTDELNSPQLRWESRFGELELASGALSYADGNPISLNDPFGLCAESMDAYVNRTVGPPPSGFWGSVKGLVSGDFHAREQAMQQWHTANNKQDGFASFQKGMAVGSDVAGIATAGLIGARAANSAPSQTVEVYRGVHADHPDLPNAYNGQANRIGGHSNPTLHNQGDNNSIFTSWSTDRNVAVGHATQWGTTNGVLLNQNVPRSSLTPSPDSLLEFEVLRTGNVNGATPTILKR